MHALRRAQEELARQSAGRGRYLAKGPRSWWALVCCVAIAASLAIPTASWAQTASGAAQQEFEALFQELLRDPSNRALNLRFIEIALEIGDYEAAIGALDRLLFSEPDNPVYLLQIADAYLALESAIPRRADL